MENRRRFFDDSARPSVWPWTIRKGTKTMTQSQPHYRIAFTVIDQDGNQRGDFPTRESAEAYLNSPSDFIEVPPSFIDKERSRVAEFIDDCRGGHFTFPQSEDVWYGYCANSLYRVHRTLNQRSITYRNTWYRRPLPNER